MFLDGMVGNLGSIGWNRFFFLIFIYGRKWSIYKKVKENDVGDS